MICEYCDEPILPGEVFQDLPNLQNLHRECTIRMVFGSAAHHRGECSCFGGTRRDPPGMTKREAARLAVVAFDELQGAKV